MSEEKLKHLEFIQSCISRMGQNSFQMKGWALTVVAALSALFAASIAEGSNGNYWFVFVAIPPTIIFWFLDSYYLQQERKFRGVYKDVVGLTNNVNVRGFEMPLDKYTKGNYSFFNVVWSRTIWPIYVPIILALTIFGFALVRC